MSFSLRQRIAIYFNPRCLFSLRQHARTAEARSTCSKIRLDRRRKNITEPPATLSGSKSRPELLVGGAERIGSLDLPEAPYRPRSAQVREDVVRAASRRRACRQHCFSGASPGRMSEESQRASSRFQTLPTRYEATGYRGGKLKRFVAILRLRLDCVRRVLSTHSATLTSLAGETVRSPPVLKNHRMKRGLGPKPCAKSFNPFVSFDLLSSLTATSEPSFEK